MLRFLNESSNLSPRLVMNHYSGDPQYPHLLRDIAVLIEIDHFDRDVAILDFNQEFS